MSFYRASLCCFLAMQALAALRAEDINFARDIQPLLTVRCVGCHGPTHQHGGLRLDTREHALKGGESGRPVIETPLEENELWRRVASNSAEVRMPLEGPRLKSEELARVKAWAMAGAPWGDATTSASAGGSAKSSSFWMAIDQRLTAWEPFYEAYRPTLWFGLFACIALAIAARFKRTSGVCQALLLPASALLAVGMIGSAAWTQYGLHQAREKKLAQSIEDLRRAINDQHALYRPTMELIRPRQSPDVRRIYYRGNDERSPKLFNGGFYRTATLELSLRDAEGHSLAAGDSCQGRIELVLDIRRAHHAAPILFTREIAEKVFLSPQNMGEPITNRAAQVFRLEIVVEGEHWRIVAPLGDANTAREQTIAGRLYVIHGNDPATDEVAGPAHYGIDYRLALKDGVLQPQSDLWMAALLNATNTIVTPPGFLHSSEWFDFRPIPEIEGEHTRDEKLIGSEPYLR
jgi:hypothetical protein